MIGGILQRGGKKLVERNSRPGGGEKSPDQKAVRREKKKGNRLAFAKKEGEAFGFIEPGGSVAQQRRKESSHRLYVGKRE